MHRIQLLILFETFQIKYWNTDEGKEDSGDSFDLTTEEIASDYKDGTLKFLGLYLPTPLH